jgi:hypothetical protein
MNASAKSPAFQPGDRVRVRDLKVSGHNRTPWYIRGKTGTIERCHGPYLNPESLAYGASGLPALPLYLVKFDQSLLWERYNGAGADKLMADIFEHWLEPARQDERSSP